MLEEILINYLSEELNIPVYAEIPADAPERFIVIQRTAGGKTDHVDNATIAVQSYAGSLYEAAELNEDVKAVMLYTMDIDAIPACHLNSDYNFTDTATKRYRYQAVYNITYYTGG